MFKIHEDTPDEELGNLMEFSTQTLDISDDESRRIEKDFRGKENIPPMDFPDASPVRLAVAAAPPATRKDMMTDEPRTPLGSLDAREYYAEGCDVNSYIIVPADKEDDCTPERTACIASEHPAEVPPAITDSLPGLLSQALESKAGDLVPASGATESPAAPIDIWESESAKGEEEREVVHEAITSPLEKPIGDNTFDLEDTFAL
jgi:hypothetical protein